MILGDKQGLKITWMIILSATVRYRWKTKKGCWDLLKGDRDRLIEVKITVIKGKQIQDFDN